MNINLREVMKVMSEQEIFDIANIAKIELKERLQENSVYEPTSNPAIDQPHYQRLQMLREMLAQLGDDEFKEGKRCQEPFSRQKLDISVEIPDFGKHWYFVWRTTEKACGCVNLQRVDITFIVHSKEEAIKKGLELLENVRKKDKRASGFTIEEVTEEILPYELGAGVDIEFA